jgi:hypothetical protein
VLSMEVDGSSTWLFMASSNEPRMRTWAVLTHSQLARFV